MTSSLPEAFYFQSHKARGDYEIYPQKFLPDTWKLLREAHIAGAPRANSDFPLSPPSGLSVMSILADCCAGKTRARVTDQGAAYATVASLLQGVLADSQAERRASSEQFVSITLRLIDPSAIDLKSLIDFRKRERKSGGHAYRDLRHRYLDRLETYVKTLTSTKGTRSDAKLLRDELAHDMKDDIDSLREELGLARNEILFSREMITSAVAGLGTIATVAFSTPLLIAGVVTGVGAPVLIGGLLGSANKYRSTRRLLLQKHPMAYLYEIESARKAISL